MQRRKNDILLKAAFEETFLHLLRFFFKEADKIFDFSRGFTFMDKELRELFPELEKNGGSRQADMLVKVFLLDGREKWVLVHIEIQEQYRRDFPKRMFKYFYRIYDRYETGITAIAVFTGKGRPADHQFTESLLGTKIVYEYNGYHILNHTEEELLEMNNPFALVVLAAQKALRADKIPEAELGNARLTIVKALIASKQYSHEKIAAFLFFLKNYLYIENADINATFDRQANLLTGKTNAMGIIETIKMLEREEGMEIGNKNGMEKKGYDVVKNLLQANRFTISEIANFANVTENFVRKVKKDLK